MPRSFWPAFSRSLVAVSISSLATWHNVSWAIDVAMRCFLHDRYAVGVGCVSTRAGAKEGYRDTSRRSPTLVFTVANHFKCISVQIEHNSVGCHGQMYFDIVETTATMYKQSKPSPPQQDQDNKTTKWEGR